MNKLLLPVFVIITSFSAPRIEAQDIHVVTTAITNLDTRTIRSKEIYTRGGVTNLVRRINSKNGKLQIQIQQIYHDGALLGDICDDKVNKVFGIYAEPNRSYALAFQFYSDKT
ncbi:MAG: hypothetical protein AAB380_04475, partial [Verrucomicrobiota bacterium]